MNQTVIDYLDQWADECADRVWLRDLSKESSEEYSWGEVREQVNAVAVALEARIGHGAAIMLLSRNRAHWVLADLAIIRSGNFTVGLFTTLPPATAQYIAEFTQAKAIFVGEADNWEKIKPVLPDSTLVVALPGVDLDCDHIKYEDLLGEGENKSPEYVNKPADMISVVFTSGTTGRPKGVIQSHESNLIPIRRGAGYELFPEHPKFFSYLPLAHLAERQIVEFQALYHCGEISFNQSLDTLLPDLQRTKPHYFFAVPRVWEQLQQVVFAQHGTREAFEEALGADPKTAARAVIDKLGLGEATYCLSGSAPISPALVHWWESVGIKIMEGFGQTEAMSLVMNHEGCRRVGSIGKPMNGVECKITAEGELVVRADGLTPGYYKQPSKTAELYRDGWLHTGDKVRVDEDGFLFISGRVKDYFKTIHGKFVAPPPIEGRFAENAHVEQQCLIGRGLSKTVMVTVLTEVARGESREKVEESIRECVSSINSGVEKHARIGAVIVTQQPWTIENDVLTPTLKVRRDKIDEKFSGLAESLAKDSAVQGITLFHWD